MAGLLLFLCIGLLMLGLATAGSDGPPPQGRSIPECDSNCGQSNPSPTASNAYLTRHCLLGTWCCPPAYRCGFVEIAGGWSCFENKSYTQSAFMETPTTDSKHNLASTLRGLSDAPVSTHPSSAILGTPTVTSTTISSKTTSETNGSPRSNTLLRWKYCGIAVAMLASLRIKPGNLFLGPPSFCSLERLSILSIQRSHTSRSAIGAAPSKASRDMPMPSSRSAVAPGRYPLNA
ncbi:hypothetical protein B0T10DRAFT_466461 [Thelonectria olida]|uniref:Uncharacterized protein n=1 Tax=Thelonectria olida TaxID=1576542 RepID=A0A9P9AIP3_9HYPO|nr:hypothetical protein B0T10DRAFT_466461 [Thelonectria olida]